MKIGLYFGSFNPIHLGHIIIANHIVEFLDIDHIWFVVSPQNPLKKKTNLLDYVHRVKMLRIAVFGYKKMSVLDIESGCSPSYTINTLYVIEKKYPKDKFTIIIGIDTLYSIKKWKNYKIILNKYDIFVYPRIGTFSNYNHFFIPIKHNKNIFLKAPIIEISSSFIRNSIQKGKNMNHLLQTEVWKYIKKHNFYRTKN
ncbi:nicotinate (nicotinamide) nucleotide adenylyltransferase [Blattabacterium sp. (Cryptocercus punctulatus) str. Cpu]|uniref:nicotinate (nicotinamide) nucleotide adenylyltransferase n=1 Tax=Blattabacterium sp. (Cryptocercus punctulatus) str. Cpu TaxID=1075399 RepID=UPI00023870EB|nr:nicotinate (nicotinamide) nucleotide adenylyltransferase [Blattabacterium sp. (Cryptocercus punctulatus) str. Cpu]AEU09354.1 nicotinate-nucleotide adenylyltransferase [Blattabacterium sp. (Cryptocercus punctulatus) str. Cpu]